jgi:hypothetical protein
LIGNLGLQRFLPRIVDGGVLLLQRSGLMCLIYRVELLSLPHSDVRLFLYILMQRTIRSIVNIIA